MGKPEDIISVATWNILADHTNLPWRVGRVAEEVSDTDVVLLQEVIATPETGSTTAHMIAALSGHQVASVYLETVYHPTGRMNVGTAILSRFPILESGKVPVPAGPGPRQGSIEFSYYASAVLEAPSGRPIFVVAVHFPWSGDREHRRLAHAVAVNEYVKETVREETLTILGGDFNTFPDSDTLRFLTGRHVVDGNGAFWVDAWSTAGDGSAGYTQDPTAGNPLIDRVAKGVGLSDASLMPARRIDYLLVRGWAYGRAGSPLNARLLGTERSPSGDFPSDHYGVRAELWDAPLAP